MDESLRDLFRSLPVFPAQMPVFDPATAPDGPVALFVRWLEEAIEAQVDAWRRGWGDGPLDQAVAFQAAQRQREHALGDALDGALKLGVTLGTVAQQAHDQHAPLVPDPVQDIALLARRMVFGDTHIGCRSG
ncbi:hypothetical protein Misp02_10850 [Microtetraspora sp. NBRC 16547]|nr:hypothetical protein Misp02_10850 [Microtetraspora sp. NBRC 16547]